MKKKYVLKNKKRFAAFVTMFILMAVFMGMMVSAGASSPVKNDYEVIKVRQGDTLWEIAQDHSSARDIREYIYDIKKLNQLEGDAIYTGQILMLP